MRILYFRGHYARILSEEEWLEVRKEADYRGDIQVIDFGIDDVLPQIKDDIF